MSEKVKIGENIRGIMKNKGYSQKELAALCGIPESTLSRFVNDTCEPKASALKTIAGVLGVTIDELVCGQKTDSIILPCKKGDILTRNGQKYTADHWNILCTAVSETGHITLFDIIEARKSLRRENDAE